MNEVGKSRLVVGTEDFLTPELRGRNGMLAVYDQRIYVYAAALVALNNYWTNESSVPRKALGEKCIWKRDPSKRSTAQEVVEILTQIEQGNN